MFKRRQPHLLTVVLAAVLMLASVFGGCRPAAAPGLLSGALTDVLSTAAPAETGTPPSETEVLPSFAPDPGVTPQAAPLPEAVPAGDTSLPGTAASAPEASPAEAETDYDRLLARKNQVFSPDSSVITAEASLLPASSSRYTLMVYMTGSNLESHYGAATRDIEEMLAAGLDFADVNLVLFTGGCQMWRGDIPASCSAVIDLSREADERIVGRTDGNADMGAPQTLSAFLDFAVSYYPADHYGLIFWDHGGGPLWGYGSDELFGDDSLMLSELRQALTASPFGRGARLDLIGFDACLMGSFEAAVLLSRFADRMVASEELEPGDGWDYSFLSVLNETSDPAVIGQRIVDDYAAFYEEASTEDWQPDYTLALYDLSQASAAARQVGRLFTRVTEGLQRGDAAAISQARTEARSFGVVEDRSSGFYHYDLVDLADLAARLEALYPAEARAVQQALSLFVTGRAANVPGTGGVSLYFPSRNKGQFEKMHALAGELAVAASCRTFFDQLRSLWQYSKSHDWNLGALTPGEDEWTLALPEEILDDLAGARYTVLRDAGTGYYLPCLSDCMITPDADGVLHIPADPEVFLLQSDTGETAFWNVTQTESNRLRETYRTVNTRLVSDPDFYLRLEDAATSRVSVSFSVDKAAGAVTAGNVTSVGADTGTIGKETVDLSLYEGVYWHCTAAVPTRDLSGRLLPFADWNKTSDLTWYIRAPYEERFTFSRVKASETAGHFLLQVVIEDAAGERYATELTPLGREGFYETAEKMPHGRLTCRVYADHAEALSYLGSDEELVLPDTVDGQPLTVIGTACFSPSTASLQADPPALRAVTLPATLKEIGADAFYGCTYLTAADIPEGVTAIGSAAFAGCLSLERVTLPDTLTRLGKCAFDGCASLTEVTLPASLEQMGEGAFCECLALEAITGAGGPGYRLSDGVLFSADGTVLLAFPAARTGAYAVPEGTGEIGFGAFAGTFLSEVSLPESLTAISGYAFYANNGLSVPDFPDTLTVIGHQAFGQTRNAAFPRPAVIRVPAGLSVIRHGAFDTWPVRTFEVSEDSTAFSAPEGNLASKAGDQLIALAWRHDAAFSVPEGITAFDWSLFDFLADCADDPRYDRVDLSLPDSVTSVTGNVLYWNTHCLTLHASPASAAQKYAENSGIRWDAHPVAPYERRVIAVPDGQLYVRVYEDHAQLVLYTGQAETLTLPETVDGVPLTVIGDGRAPIEYTPNADYGEWKLTEAPDTLPLQHLILPETVTTLSARCLAASALACRELTLPAGLAVIGDAALPAHGDTPWELPAHLVSLGQRFAVNPGPVPVSAALTCVAPGAVIPLPGNAGFVQTEPNETFSVVNGALCSADGKTLLVWPFTQSEGGPVLPDGLTAIGPYALAYTGYSDITLPEGITEVAEYAFASCPNLTSVTLPASLTRIGHYAFAWCPQLARVDGGTGLNEIADHAFYNDANLAQLPFGPALTVIESSAFAGTAVCPNSLPESLSYIGDDAFAGLQLPEDAPAYTLRIGKNVRSIGYEAFTDARLTAYEVDAENRLYTARDGFLCDLTGQTVLACPAGLSGAVTVPEGTVMIRAYAFAGCGAVTDITLPASVVHISPLAFGDAGSAATLHVTPGSPAERFAIQQDMTYVFD